MRLRVLLLLAGLVPFVLACKSATVKNEFIPLHEGQYQALPDGQNVVVRPLGNADGYTVIGLITVFDVSVVRRIEVARTLARQYGAELIMPQDIRDEAGLSNQRFESKDQSFLVFRKSDGVPEAPGGYVEPERTGPAVATSPAAVTGTDFAGLPRLTFEKLLAEGEKLSGNMYQGRLVPVQIYFVPASLPYTVAPDQKLVLMRNNNGSRRLLMLVPAERAESIRPMIEGGAALDFVYRPVGRYRADIPLVQFVASVSR
jgi:hypothetical protein